MRLHRFVAAFMLFWFGGVSVGLVSFSVAALRGQMVPLQALLIPLGMLLFGILLTTCSFWWEAKKAKPFLIELFKGIEQQPAINSRGVENRNSKIAVFGRNILAILLCVVAVIFVNVSIRYGTDYIYSRFRATGLTPNLPYVGERVGKAALVDVYLMPFEGFPDATAGQIANILSKELNINIKTTPGVAIPPGKFDEKRKQYIGELMGDPIAQIIVRMDGTSSKTAYIGLLNADMYPSDSNWNYMFSKHFARRISVVAAGRLIPSGFISREEAAKLYGTRLLKLVKRAIGQQYFDMPRS